MTIAERVRSDIASLEAVAHLGAVVERNDAAALARAADLDVESSNSRWHGRTITVKDWIDVEGFACEGEAVQRSGRRPTNDATTVARLRALGAIVIAKTQPQAFHAVHGTCLHPIDPARNPGGSSSGEAVLIGSGATSLGLGSDSGGSIRLPAAWCGAFGFKPSFGLVPNTGHWPRVGARHDGRTVIGPISTRLADVWPTLEAICGPDGSDPDCAPVRLGTPASVRMEGLRVAVVEANTTWPVDRATRDALGRALNALQETRGDARRGGACAAPRLGSILDSSHAFDPDVRCHCRSDHRDSRAVCSPDERRRLRVHAPVEFDGVASDQCSDGYRSGQWPPYSSASGSASLA